jgi:membrane fusion protein (multidrug efflux system)
VLNQGPTNEDIRQAQATVMQAQDALAKAVAPGASTDLSAQQAAVEQQVALLQKAQTPYVDFDMQSAVAGVAQAEAQVALAQANLDTTTVVAPFDGVISTRALSAGAFASPQSPILTLASNQVEIHVTVEEARVAQIQPGQSVQLTVPAYPDATFPAKVVTIAPSGDTRAHTFDVKIVPDNQDQRLLPGMFAQVQVVAAQKPDALLIPKEAVVNQNGNTIVFVNNNGTASQRQVTTGMSNDTQVEITSGLTPGEPVVVVGQSALRDGMPIQDISQQQNQGGQGGQGGGGRGQGGGGQGQGQGGQGQGQGGQGQGQQQQQGQSGGG